jgi:hypothetical protein
MIINFIFSFLKMEMTYDKFVNEYLVNMKNITFVNEYIMELVNYKHLPYLFIFIHFTIILLLIENVRSSILNDCKNTINYYFTNKIKCFKYHIKQRRNITRKTTNIYKLDNTEKIINEINFSNFEEFYDYQYPIIKEFYDNFTDEQICDYALSLFDSKFAIIKES